MKTLSSKELAVGMVTTQPIKTPLGQILAPAGTIIDQRLLRHIAIYRVDYVTVDEESIPSMADAAENTTLPEDKPAEEFDLKASVKKMTSAQKAASSVEVHKFEVEYFSAIQQIKPFLLAAVEKGTTIPCEELLDIIYPLFEEKTVQQMFDLLRNLRSNTDLVYAHSLNVALTARMLGRWLKMDMHDLNQLTIAGLLHDIGKLTIPEVILDKPGTLGDEEYAIMKSHTKRGYDILKNMDLDSRIKKAALMHHERCDGSGYPSGLTEENIDDFAMIIGIADVYDAMTAARSYRSPLCPFQVIANFEKDGYQKYQTKYILTFLRKIAVTYQSNRVILSDGRGCNIAMLNSQDLSRPLVRFDDNSCLDLSKERDLFIKTVI